MDSGLLKVQVTIFKSLLPAKRATATIPYGQIAEDLEAGVRLVQISPEPSQVKEGDVRPWERRTEHSPRVCPKAPVPQGFRGSNPLPRTI